MTKELNVLSEFFRILGSWVYAESLYYNRGQHCELTNMLRCETCDYIHNGLNRVNTGQDNL
jgi:hypothetical protein